MTQFDNRVRKFNFTCLEVSTLLIQKLRELNMIEKGKYETVLLLPKQDKGEETVITLALGLVEE